MHTVVPPDDGPRYAPKHVEVDEIHKNKLCIKLAFLYTILLKMCSS